MPKEENHRSDYTSDTVKMEEDISSGEFQSTEISTMRAKTAKKAKFFNWLDIVLIVLLVAVVLCVIFRFNPFTGKVVRENTQPITVTVLLENVDDAFADSIKKGYAVYENDESCRYIGIVESVEPLPAHVYSLETATDTQGTGGRMNIKVTVKVESAKYTKKNGYSVSGVRLAVGAEKKFKFTSFVADGTIIGLCADSES